MPLESERKAHSAQLRDWAASEAPTVDESVLAQSPFTGLVPTSITQGLPRTIPETMAFTASHTSKAVSSHHTGHSAGVRKGCNVFQGTYASLVSAWHRVVTEQKCSISQIHFFPSPSP